MDKPSAAEGITITSAYIHNLLRINSTTKQLHSPLGTLDFVNSDKGTVIEEEWRREIQNDSRMIKLTKTPRYLGNDAKKIRNIFLDFFMSYEGRVSWQDKYL
jgi:hypothetical protein